MKKSRFSEEQMVKILRAADRSLVADVARRQRGQRADDLRLAQALREARGGGRAAAAAARHGQREARVSSDRIYSAIRRHDLFRTPVPLHSDLVSYGGPGGPGSRALELGDRLG
jgi:hypothetical protein